MTVKDIIWEDYVNYKECCTFIIFPMCSFKCNKDCGKNVCHNQSIIGIEDKCVSTWNIVKNYMKMELPKAVVCGGLEPFDSWYDLKHFITMFRIYSDDNIIIYSGYNKEELCPQIEWLQKNTKNIIVKFGRYIPDSESVFDTVLGITLASKNQYAERVC